MKVVAKVSDNEYLCEIDHTELEKFLDLYYHKLDRLKVGQEIDLGASYELHEKAEIAFEKTRKFVESNKELIETITDGFILKVRSRS